MLPPFSPISGARLKWGLGRISWTKSPCSSFVCILRNCRFSDSSPRVQNMNSFFFFNWLFITSCAYTKEARIWILKKILFPPRPGKIQTTAAIKQMGREETTFSFWGPLTFQCNQADHLFCLELVWNETERKETHIA